jgi:hypothetical protein
LSANESPEFSGTRLIARTSPANAKVSGVEIGIRKTSEDKNGGDGGIRTLDRALQPYNGLANRRLQPLGHISGRADMPDAEASRKRPI